MLTNKGKYALKALVHLAGLEPGRTASIAGIAEANSIPKKFLDSILLDLRNAGFVRSKKGPGGGVALARAPEEIKIGAVIRAIDGPLAPIGCASRTAFRPCDDCEDLETCPVRLTMVDVRDAMSEILDKTSLAQMAGRSRNARAWALPPAAAGRTAS
jgi:Rrf2 family protein